MIKLGLSHTIPNRHHILDCVNVDYMLCLDTGFCQQNVNFFHHMHFLVGKFVNLLCLWICSLHWSRQRAQTAIIRFCFMWAFVARCHPASCLLIILYFLFLLFLSLTLSHTTSINQGLFLHLACKQKKEKKKSICTQGIVHHYCSQFTGGCTPGKVGGWFTQQCKIVTL